MSEKIYLSDSITAIDCGEGILLEKEIISTDGCDGLKIDMYLEQAVLDALWKFIIQRDCEKIKQQITNEKK